MELKLINSAVLQKQFQTFEKYSGGILGICAQHIETGCQVQFNTDQRFLMCSTYKLPIALCLLNKVEQGEISLTTLYEITEYDLRPGVASTLNQLDYTINPQFSVLNLLKFMLQESCNTATDILFKLINGPATVMQYLEKITIKDMRIDRTVLEALSSWDGINQQLIDQSLTLATYAQLEHNVSQEASSKAKEIFKTSLNDTTKPTAMTELLVKLFNKKLVNERHTQLLLNIMYGCKRGSQRLTGLLPENTPFSHKTGTLTGYTADVGIMTLPHGKGNIAIAAYIKESKNDLTTNEHVLAETGRTLYDFFLFST